MIKHVNFTGRRRISQASAQIEVFDGPPRSFAVKFDFSGTKMPTEAKVFLEAMCAGSPVVKRFDFGTVGNTTAPDDLTLEEIKGENVFFALKVVDENERMGRILGLAENIRPLKADKLTVPGRQGILPIDVGPLGQEVWKLDLTHEHEVFLIVNEAIPGLKDRAKWDPLFYAVVYPAVVRIILAAALDRGATVDDDDENWPTLWLRFGRQLHPEHAKPPSNDTSDEEAADWIDEVVAAFAEAYALSDQYAKSLLPLEGEET